MSDTETEVGPFYYVSLDESFEAWGFTFPSGYTVLEWEPVDDEIDDLEEPHQSVYHSVEDFQTVCTGRVDWGVSPTDFNGVGE
jgi:hypothetical protein